LTLFGQPRRPFSDVRNFILARRSPIEKKRAEILNREHQAVKSPDTITAAAATNMASSARRYRL
jgi:hypothetical protein